MHHKLTGVLIVQVVLSLAVGACSSAESTQPKSDGRSVSSSAETVTVERAESEEKTGPPSDVVSQLIRRALRADGSVSRRLLVRRLGPPRHVDERPIANQYVQGQVDTVRTLVYRGVKALVYDVTSESKSFLLRLSLSSPRYATPEGLRVGVSEREVIETIGPPTRRSPTQNELIYQETDTPSTSLVVRVKGDRVVRIDWEFSFT
jgi:hypothetical protein